MSTQTNGGTVKKKPNMSIQDDRAFLRMKGLLAPFFAMFVKHELK